MGRSPQAALKPSISIHLPSLGTLTYDIVEVHGDVVLGGHPLDPLEEGHNRDGDVGHHEDREGEEVGEDAPLPLGVDVLALTHGGDDGENKEDDVHRHEGHDKRADAHGKLGVSRDEAVAKRPDDEVGRVHEGGEQRQDHAGSDRHQHVVGGELPRANAVEEVPVIREEHLVEPLGPAHALYPGRLEGERLLVEELCRGVADADAVGAAEG